MRLNDAGVGLEVEGLSREFEGMLGVELGEWGSEGGVATV